MKGCADVLIPAVIQISRPQKLARWKGPARFNPAVKRYVQNEQGGPSLWDNQLNQEEVIQCEKVCSMTRTVTHPVEVVDGDDGPVHSPSPRQTVRLLLPTRPHS